MPEGEKVIASLGNALVQMHGCGRYTPEDVDELETAAWKALKLLEGQDRMRMIDGDALLEELPVHPDGGMRSVKNACLMMRVRETVKNAPTVNGWISVKDKLPKIGDTVLFTGLSSFGTRFIPQRGWFDGTFWKRDTGETVYSSTPVTHWMPLPSTEGLDET